MSDKSEQFIHEMITYAHAAEVFDVLVAPGTIDDDTVLRIWEKESADRVAEIRSAYRQDAARRTEDSYLDLGGLTTRHQADIAELDDTYAADRATLDRKHSDDKAGVERQYRTDKDEIESAISIQRNLGSVGTTGHLQEHVIANGDFEKPAFKNLSPARLDLLGLRNETVDSRDEAGKLAQRRLTQQLRTLVPALESSRRRTGIVRNWLINGSRLPKELFTHVRGQSIYFHGTSDDMEYDINRLMSASGGGTSQAGTDILRIFAALGKQQTGEDISVVLEDPEQTSLREINFSHEVMILMPRNEIDTVGKLVQLTDQDLLNYGATGDHIKEIKLHLSALGFSLGQTVRDEVDGRSEPDDPEGIGLGIS